MGNKTMRFELRLTAKEKETLKRSEEHTSELQSQR